MHVRVIILFINSDLKIMILALHKRVNPYFYLNPGIFILIVLEHLESLNIKLIPNKTLV